VDSIPTKTQQKKGGTLVFLSDLLLKVLSERKRDQNIEKSFKGLQKGR